MGVSFQEKRWADFPNVTFNFDCTDRPIGFYADLEFDCMVSLICSLTSSTASVLFRYSTCVTRTADAFPTCVQTRRALIRSSEFATGIITWTAPPPQTGGKYNPLC